MGQAGLAWPTARALRAMSRCLVQSTDYIYTVNALLGPGREIWPQAEAASFRLLVVHVRQLGTLFWGEMLLPLPMLLLLLPSILVLIATQFFTPVSEVCGRGSSRSFIRLQTEGTYWMQAVFVRSQWAI
jgi:hypothetical protein